MKLSIRVCASEKYLYVWKHVIRKIAVAAAHRKDVHIVYVSDGSEACRTSFNVILEECPKHWEKEHIALDVADVGLPYKIEQQTLIARMHAEGFSAARRAGAEQCWTVEADVLVPEDSLRVLEWALLMPQADGSPYYDVAFCTYPNGQFIGGFGTPSHNIAEDFLAEERIVPTELLAKYEQVKKDEKRFSQKKIRPDEAWIKKATDLNEELRKCPPKGNVFQLNAAGYRRRGWMDSAYPGIGRGAIVPVDWCGEGCNLLSKRALSIANYDGYEGKGTQDLYLVWHKFYPNNVRIACVPHTVCDHVKLQDGKPVHHQSYHEQQGECKGHLRVVRRDWVEI